MRGQTVRFPVAFPYSTKVQQLTRTQPDVRGRERTVTCTDRRGWTCCRQKVRQPAPADDAAGEAEEGFVDVVADLPADPQPTEPVQQRETLLDDPAVHAQARAMLFAAPGDNRGDPGFPDLLAVLVVVIATVGVDPIRVLAGPATAAAHRRDGLDEGHELGDVVAVPAGQRHRQRDAVRFGDQVVLRARPGTIDRARPCFGPPFSART